MDNILNVEKDIEIRALRSEIERLTNIITKQDILLKEYGHEGDLNITDEEAIVVKQLSLVRSRSDNQELDGDDVKKLESLMKSLHSIRNKNPRNIKKDFTKKSSTEDLLNVARIATATAESDD